MLVVLHNIRRLAERGMLELLVSVGNEAPKSFTASYDDSDHECRVCNMEEELFMRLSDLAVRRYGHCGIYQMELMDIVGAFMRSEPHPPFPIELGTTSFGLRRPGPLRIIWNQAMRLLHRFKK